MSWVKIDTSYLSHPKIVGLHEQSKLLHLASILWTAEHLTDGDIPVSALRAVVDRASIAPRWAGHRVAELVSRGLWDELASGWHVHDFETHNRTSTRAFVERERESWADRQRRHRGSVTPLHRLEEQ